MSQGDDVQLGIKFSNDTRESIEATARRIKSLDQEIISVQENLGKLERDLRTSFSGKNKGGSSPESFSRLTDEYHAYNKHLSNLLGQVNTEKAAAQRTLDKEAKSLLGNNPNARHKTQVLSAIDSTFKSLTNSTVDIQQAQLDALKKFEDKLRAQQRKIEAENDRVLKKAQQRQKQNAKNAQSKKVADLKVASRSGANVDKLSNAEVAQLKKRSASLSNEAATLSNYQAAQEYSQLEKELTSVLDQRKNPKKHQRLQRLTNLALGEEQLDPALSLAGLKSYQRGANRYSTVLADKNARDPLAEAMRELSSTIQKEIDAKKPLKEQTVRQKQGELDEVQRQEFARKRYNDKQYFGKRGAYSNLDSAELSDQRYVRDKVQRLRDAQKLRYTQAQSNKESKETIELERKAFDLADKRLDKLKAIVKQQESLNRSKAKEKSQDKGIDIPKLQQRAKDNAIKSQIANDVDSGGGKFRNQALLLRNYAVMGAGIGAAHAVGSFAVDLDSSMKQLQSILALTNNEMLDLEDNLVRVSEQTKFTAVEVTEAGIVLGQAGLSKDQIVDTIEGITLFATAIGTDLKSAVDLATSTLGVFNIESSRMPEVVDKLTTAVNRSKLNLEKLSLGIQYAGNIAAQSNVSFDETVAALGAMANSGIRSGSTLGTGLRQILIALQKPSEGFRKKMSELNVDMEQLDIRTHGLVNVMTTLANAGFTVTDAMQTMQVRAASAYGAFSNNLDVAEELTEAMQSSGSASKANTVQMTSLANQWARFGSIARSVFYEALEPYLEFLTKALEKGGDFLSLLKESKDVLQLMLGGFIALQGIKISAGVLKLLAFLAKNPVGKLIAGAGGASTAGIAASAGTGIAARALPAILGGPVVAGLATAVTLGTYAYSNATANRRYEDPLDKATANVNENEADLKRYDHWLKTLSSSMDSLYLKQAQFADGETGSKALTKFINTLNVELKDMGFFLDSNATSFEEVSAKLKEFRTNVANFNSDGLTKSGVLLKEQLLTQIDSLSPEIKRETRQQSKVDQYRYNRENISKREVFYGDTQFEYGTRFSLEEISPELKNLRLSETLDNLSKLDIDNNGYAKAKENLGRIIAYRNILTGIGNLPDEKLKQGLKFTAKTGNRDDDLVDFKVGIQNLLNYTETIKDKASEITESAKKYDKVTSGEPQALNKIVADLQNKYQGQVRDLQVQLGQDQKRIRTKGKDDPLLRHDLAEKLQKRFTEQINSIQEEVKSEAKAALETFFGEGKSTGVQLNKVLNATDIVSSSQGVYSEILGFVQQQQKPAQSAYFAQTEGELRTLSEDKKLNNLLLTQAKNKPEIDALELKLIAIEDQIAAIKTKRNKFDSSDQATSDKLDDQEKLAKISRDAYIQEQGDRVFSRIREQERLTLEAERRAQYNAELKALKFKAKSEADFQRRSKELQKNFEAQQRKEERERRKSELKERRYAWERAQGINDYYKDYALGNKQQRLKAETTLIEDQTGAKQTKSSAERQARFGGDSQVGEDTSAARNLSAINLYEQSSKEFANGIARLVEVLKAQNLANTGEIAGLQATINDPLNAGKVSDTAKINSQKLRTEIENNNKTIAKLNGQLEENIKATGDQTDALRLNNRVLQNEGYTFKTAEKRRRTSELRGGTFSSDQGQTEDFSFNPEEDDVSRFFSIIFRESNKAYEGFDLLTEASLGLQSVIVGMGDAGANAFKSWVDGSASASDAFKGFTLSIIDSMLNLAAQMTANSVMEQVLGLAASAFGGSTGGMGDGVTTIGLGSNVQTAWNGGLIYGGGYSTGGAITSGIESRDSTLIKAAKGEFVLRQAAVKALGIDRVRALNNLDASTVSSLGNNSATLEPQAIPTDKGSSGDVNIWVVTEQEKVQNLGPNDVVTIIQEDALKNGKTKRLIKRIAKGEL